MNEPHGYYAKLNKTEKGKYHIGSLMRSIFKKSKSQIHKNGAEKWLAGAGVQWGWLKVGERVWTFSYKMHRTGGSDVEHSDFN